MSVKGAAGHQTTIQISIQLTPYIHGSNSAISMHNDDTTKHFVSISVYVFAHYFIPQSIDRTINMSHNSIIPRNISRLNNVHSYLLPIRFTVWQIANHWLLASVIRRCARGLYWNWKPQQNTPEMASVGTRTGSSLSAMGSGIVPWAYHPDRKIHEANMGPLWGRQEPVGTHVGPMNFAIWIYDDVIYIIDE